MRILLVHRHYHPDTTTYAHMLRFMAEHFAAQGHDVTVATGAPSYNQTARGMTAPKRETSRGVHVRRFPLPRNDRSRIPLRLLSTLLFWIAVVGYATVRRARFDVVVVTTMPPVVMGLAALVIRAARGSRYVYHCMDLYPEIGIEAGLLHRSPLTALAKRLDRLVGERAWRVVVLSEDMRRSLQHRGQSVDNVCIINNFAIDDEQATSDVELPGDPAKTRLVYAGNLGLFQSLEDLLSAVAQLPDHHLTFVGEGRAETPLRDAAASLPDGIVSFLPFLPVEDARELVRQADLAVVSLERGIIKYAYPSKLITYLRAGTPVLAIVEPDSELAKLVRKERVGLVAEATPDSIRAALACRSGLADPNEVKAVANRHFSREMILQQWDELLTGTEVPF